MLLLETPRLKPGEQRTLKVELLLSSSAILAIDPGDGSPLAAKLFAIAQVPPGIKKGPYLLSNVMQALSDEQGRLTLQLIPGPYALYPNFEGLSPENSQALREYTPPTFTWPPQGTPRIEVPPLRPH